MGFFGKSSTFPITGYPFGPGGYGGRLGAHRLRNTARAIAVATTTTTGPKHFSNMDMADSGREGDRWRLWGFRSAVFKIPGFNGLVSISD